MISGDQMEAHFKALMDVDKWAREHGTLKGRVIRHQYADGYAFYQIVKVFKNSVRAQVCKNIGDDWVLPAWGETVIMKIDHAKRFMISDIFG